jgi:predicted metal-dependent enzyme (double-stranded beta helix superfamily)
MMMSTSTAQTTGLQALIGQIRAEVARSTATAILASRVAALLEPFLGAADLLTREQQAPDPRHYRQHILHVEPDGSFSLVALVWLPGQRTPVHDHVSWCVVGVHQGEEHETRYTLWDGQALMESGQTINPQRSVAALTPPGDIHHVANAGTGLAISIHVYGADIQKLGSSIRRTYDLPIIPTQGQA